jgi:hypothetical protein
MCIPITAPRTFGENVRAISAAAGAWYEPDTMPMSTRNTSRCQYSPAVASATLTTPIRRRPRTMTVRDPIRSASTPQGAFARPADSANADAAMPLCA